MKKSHKKMLIWFNGNVIPFSEAKINIMNTSAQYGINVFEGVRCYKDDNNKILHSFRLREHIERLLTSAKLLRLDLPSTITIDYLQTNIKKVVSANNLKEDIYIKVGIYLDGEGSWSSTNPIGVFILPFPKGRVYTDLKGLSCNVSTWERISDSVISPRIKSGANYMNSRFAFLEAKMNGYDSAIFMNRYGKVSEGPGACLFIVRNGKLITPPVTASILESITRESIIDFAKHELNIEVEERDIDRTELYISDEVFFAGTAIEIVPILSVDKFVIGEGIGTITSNIKRLYFEIAQNRNKKYNKWLMEIN